ncbi:MAG TPA: DUF4595 domain-containing protein [Candidatus Avibacteroides faecavium]|nr:DUF4595 domain-containing protein [Candidatus Avibacteroides faecavium]
MKNITLLTTAAWMAAAIGLCTLSSCEKEEDIPAVDNSGTGNVNPANVIVADPYVRAHYENWLDCEYVFDEQGLLSEVWDVDIYTDEDGVTHEDRSLSLRYEYGNGTATIYAEEPPYDGTVQTVCQYQIGANGFANSAVIGHMASGDRYFSKFYYDSEGHLIKINDGGDECILRYSGGNLSSYTNYSDGEDEVTFKYAGENKLKYMPYINEPETFEGDFREVWWAYIAGIMGKPSKDLISEAYIDYHGRYTNVTKTASYYYDYKTGLLESITWIEQY